MCGDDLAETKGRFTRAEIERFPEPSIVTLLERLDLTSVEPVLCEAYSQCRRRPSYPPAAMLSKHSRNALTAE